MKIKIAYTISLVIFIAGLFWIAFIERLVLSNLDLDSHSVLVFIILNLALIIIASFLVLLISKKSEAKINELLNSLSNKESELLKVNLSQKKLIKKLKETEGIFETVVRKLPTGLIIFTRKFDFYLINEKVSEITGYSHNDIPNLKTALLKALPDQIYRTNIKKIFIEDYKKLLTSGEEAESRLIRVTCKDGSYKLIEVKVFHYDSFIFLTLNDKTKIIEAQKTSEKNKENLKRFFEQTPLPTIFYDLKGNIIQVNYAWRRLWELENEEEVLKSYNLLEDEQSYKNGYIEAFQKALKGEVVELEPVLYKPEYSNLKGRNRWIKSKVFPIVNEFSLVKYIVFQHEDITKEKESELALIESENRFRRLVENSPNYILRLSGNFTITYISPNIKEHFENGSDLIGKKLQDSCHKKQIDNLISVLKKLIRSKEKQNIILETKINGKPGLLQWDFIPEISGFGEVVSIIGIARNITQEVEQQNKIIELKNFYERVIEKSSNAFLVLDENNNIKFCNDSFLKLFKLEKSPSGFDELSPVLINQVKPYFDKVKKFRENLNFEITLSIDKEYFFLAGISPVLEGNNFKGTILTLFDNTINKTFENALKKLTVGGSSKLGKAFLDAIVKELSEIIKADITFIGQLLPGNKIRTLSVYSENRIVENFEYNLSETPCSDVMDVDVCVFPEKVTKLYPNDYLLQEMDIEGYIGVNLIDSENNPIGIVVALYKNKTEDSLFTQNILKLFASRISNELERIKKDEDLRKLSGKLKEKNKELEQIIYVSSHDLRSPLINVDGFSKEIINSLNELKEYISQIKIDDEIKAKLDFILNNDIPESTNIICKSISQMDYLLKSLLKLSRLGRESLEFSTIDVNSLLNEISINHEFTLINSQIDLELGNLPECYSDKSQLFHVFSNLLENAIKYSDNSKENKWIKISGSKSDFFAIYEVEDNGIGIEKSKQDKIFEIFYRSNPKETQGEGIGLTIVKKVLSRIGAKIEVESTPGVGSKFKVFVPLTEEILRREIDFS